MQFLYSSDARARLSSPRSAAAGLALLAAFSLPPSTAQLPDPAPLPQLLTLLDGIAEGSWVQVNLNAFADVWTPEQLRPFLGASLTRPSPAAIIKAWSSFAWDPNRGDLWLFGGGHANYTGNDVYRWRGSTRRWERASLPSGIKLLEGTPSATLPEIWISVDGVDNAPASMHTYDNQLFLPLADRFLTFGGAGVNGEGRNWVRSVAGDTLVRTTGPYLFDPNRADGDKVGGSTGSHVKEDGEFPDIQGGMMWQNRDSYHNASESDSPNQHINGTTDYALENGREVVYVNAIEGSGFKLNLFKYTLGPVDAPEQDSWQLLGTFFSGAVGPGAGAYSPQLNVFVRTTAGGLLEPEMLFHFWDLNGELGANNRNIRFIPEDPSGNFYPRARFGMGLDYDPLRERFLVWPGDGSGQVWALLAPQPLGAAGWRLTPEPAPVGARPPASNPQSGGVGGKWKYVANLDAFVTLEDPTEGNVWLYKPTGWQRPGPPNTILADDFEE